MACPNDKSGFPGGITNGAHWYSLAGGMQDYNYRYKNCMEITLELSCCKYPKGSDLSSFWKANKEPLIAYMQQVHMGVKGVVRYNTGKTVGNTVVTVVGNEKTTLTTSTGEYWRLLLPGKYVISICNVKVPVVVQKGIVSRLDFQVGKCPETLGSSAVMTGARYPMILAMLAVVRWLI